jgi:hypothetical protein
MTKIMKEYSMDKKAIQSRKSKLKHKRVIRKAFPNRWDNAKLLSKCCDAVGKSGVSAMLCTSCKQTATFRKVV